eukprot:2077082-Amphidinium_carterae.1
MNLVHCPYHSIDALASGDLPFIAHCGLEFASVAWEWSCAVMLRVRRHSCFCEVEQAFDGLVFAETPRCDPQLGALHPIHLALEGRACEHAQCRPSTLDATESRMHKQSLKVWTLARHKDSEPTRQRLAGLLCCALHQHGA